MHKVFLPFITVAFTLFMFLSSFEIERKDFLFEYNDFYDDRKQVNLDTMHTFYELQKEVINKRCDFGTEYTILTYHQEKKIPTNSGVLCMWGEGNCVLIRTNNIIRINDTTSLNTDKLLYTMFNPDKISGLPRYYNKVFFELGYSKNTPIQEVTNALDSIYTTYKKAYQKVAFAYYSKEVNKLSQEELKVVSNKIRLNILISTTQKNDDLSFDYRKDDLLSNLNE